MTAAELLARFTTATRTRNGADVKCPAHDDRRASLSIAQGDKGLVLRCHAGCSVNAIAGALGLTLRDLFDGSKPNGSAPRITATYDYVDASGTLLYQVVRYAPKDFRQRRPDGHGGWIWDLKGVERVLYRLPEIAAAAAQGGTAYVAEGEKDADALRALGLTATTNAGGAGKWTAAYAETLRGARIVILPDNDEPGRKHAAAVAESLRGMAASITVLKLPNLPPKGDVSDWLAAGGTREGLDRLVEAAPSAALPEGLVRLSTVAPEAVSWVWRGYIPRGKTTVLDGDPGLGKSTLTLDLIARVTRGVPMPDGTPGIDGGAVILTAEDGLADTVSPRLRAAGADLARVVALTGVGGADGALVFPSLDKIPALAEAIRSVGARLMVIDPLMAYLPGAVNSWRDQDVRSILAPIAALAEATGCAVLVVRHLTKAPGGSAIYRGGGSIGIAGAARCALLVAKDPDDETGRVLAGVKSNLGPLPASLKFRVEAVDETARIAWHGSSDHGADALLAVQVRSLEDRSALDDAKEFLREVLAGHPVPQRDVLKQARQVGLSEITLLRAKQALRVRSEKSGFGAGWRWRLPEDDQSQNLTTFEDGQEKQVDPLRENGGNLPKAINTPEGDQAQSDTEGVTMFDGPREVLDL